MRKIKSIADLGIGQELKLKVGFRKYIKYTIKEYRDTPMGGSIYISSEVKNGYKTGTDGWVYIDNIINSNSYYCNE